MNQKLVKNVDSAKKMSDLIQTRYKIWEKFNYIYELVMVT